MNRAALKALVVASVLLLTATGCAGRGGEEAPAAETTSVAPTDGTDGTDGTDDPCDLLPSDAAEALAGEPMVSSQVADVGGMPACQMSGTTRGIQVAQVPATEWAAIVPGLIDQLRGTSGLGEVNEARMEEMAAKLDGARADALEACELFSIMASFNGTPEGQSWTVAYVPDATAPQALSAQSCEDGTYTSVMLVGPDITASAELEASIRSALDSVGSA